MKQIEQHQAWIAAHASSWAATQGGASRPTLADTELPEELPYGDTLTELAKSRLVPRARWNEIADRVYFIGCNEEFVKIGYTGIIFRRLAALRQANPYPLNPLAIVAGDARLERALINRFSDFRTTGEWFMLVGELAEFLRSPAVIEARR